MKHEQLLNELFKFIKLIPESILFECVADINFPNRSERRKYEKFKSLDSKILALLKNTFCRINLIENMYSKYSDATESEDLSYEEVLSSINSTNCIPRILYMLHLCCNEDFDNRYFSDFIQSEQFQKTIKDEWNTTDANEEHMGISPQSYVKEESSLTYYLGYIELRATYYNFKPQYLYDDTSKTITEIPFDTLKERFPEHGSVNLGYKKFGDTAHDFLKSINIDRIDDITSNSRCTSIYAIKFDENELEDTGNDKILRKLDLQKLCEEGEELQNRIKPISDFDIYKIVTPKETINDESFAGMIHINEKEYPANEKVLLEYGKNLFGPYVLQERSIDGEKYVRPDSGIQKYVLTFYNENDYIFHTFEKRPYLQDTVYTDVAQLVDSPSYKDMISDSILLTKIIDSIDLNLLSNNPEEFERLYSTSPFLGDIPEEIRNHRTQRVHSILKNTSDYSENKMRTLSSLIDSLDDEILANKIQDSKQYKKLQKEVADLQDENGELTSKNEILEEYNKSLKLDIAQLKEENSTINTSIVDTEKIDILEIENSQLREKLSLVENLESLSEKYSSLQEKYTQEKALYDSKVIEVNKKSQELENIKAQVQGFITDELNKADATTMLRTAFDPYISNAMIEAAGNYRVDAEADQYKSIFKELQNFKCPEIDKNTLIDMLVENVQKFRKYSKNEILNMFICFSQNFLTIFSGEPGTGKTSICNILASSLGLNNFGESNNISKNRFIPISVERGWSSKRDLIGYFNPLTKKYDRSNAKIYDGLMILNEEREKSRFPYLILLDEANLSPIEYYWADFMRAADNSGSDVFVNIGLDKDIYIPKTLHFLATINNDQTTEQLSPRLIDRAWIIKLPKVNVAEETFALNDCLNSIVLWSDIEKAFVFSEVKEMSLKTLAEQIYKLFDEHHLTVSPRVQQSIKKYVCVAQEIMEDEIGVCNKKEKALDFAIVQKLLPKINGYYKDYERLFTSLAQICDENHLLMTKEALFSLEEFQRQNMGYCQYLV